MGRHQGQPPESVRRVDKAANNRVWRPAKSGHSSLTLRAGGGTVDLLELRDWRPHIVEGVFV
jgi:hypothetical protein